MNADDAARREAALAIERLARRLTNDGDWRDEVPFARYLLVEVFDSIGEATG